MRPSSEAERRRLNELFAELCAIPSPFGAERACADRVTAELRSMGLEVAEDDSAAETGAGSGNLLARIPGRSERSILLCAHLDTVGLDGPVEPVVEEDRWVNRHDAILGADNKAAVAVILQAARRASVEGSPVGLELLFTASEENALAGAKAFDTAQLRSEWGYVFDHATPIGEVIDASPWYFRFDATFHGQAAHAGIRPEDGRSAILAAARAIASMRLGRLDGETTANVAQVHGGSPGTNVVPDRCTITGEVRSLDQGKAEAVVAELVDRIHDAANQPSCFTDADVVVEQLFRGYRRAAQAPSVVAAEEALRASGYAPRRVASGGGSDANALQDAGFECTNLANGTERNHQPDERVSIAALESMLDVTLNLLEASAHV